MAMQAKNEEVHKMGHYVLKNLPMYVSKYKYFIMYSKGLMCRIRH